MMLLRDWMLDAVLSMLCLLSAAPALISSASFTEGRLRFMRVLLRLQSMQAHNQAHLQDRGFPQSQPRRAPVQGAHELTGFRGFYVG